MTTPSLTIQMIMTLMMEWIFKKRGITMTKEFPLFGASLSQEHYIESDQQKRFFFRNALHTSTFAIDDPSVFKNTLLLGGAGSGKTNVMNQFVAQTRSWNYYDNSEDSICLIFDTKGDYIRHRNFYQTGDYILANDRTFRDRSAVWNIFDEILIDGKQPIDYEVNAREIASVLFKDRGSKTQPFFANAARDIFANTLIYFIRRRRDNPSRWRDKLHNKYLVTFLMGTAPSQFAKYFQLYPDMHGLISYIGDGTSNQALGVFGELRSMLYDCFQGVFAREPDTCHPSFSIRQAVRQKGNKAIFILYDLSIGETMTPIYRLLVDLALKESLGGSTNGRTHIFLDELKLLPKITHLEDALNFGRSKRVSVTAGLQSIGQIYEAYGKEAGQVILGGFGNVIAFRMPDYESREYVSKLFGPNVMSYRYYNLSNTPIDKERQGFTVEQWDLQNLKPGQAVVGLASQATPFSFCFEKDCF